MSGLTAQQCGLVKRLVAQTDLLGRCTPVILSTLGVNGITIDQRLKLEHPVAPTDGEYIELIVNVRLAHSELSYRVDRDLRDNETTKALYDPDANIRVCLDW